MRSVLSGIDPDIRCRTLSGLRKAFNPVRKCLGHDLVTIYNNILIYNILITGHKMFSLRLIKFGSSLNPGEPRYV